MFSFVQTIFQANEILFAFHRVLSVQLTMPHVHYEEPVSDGDDGVDSYVPLTSLSSDSVDGAAAVAVF